VGNPLPAGTEQFGAVDVDHGLMAGEGGVGADELETGGLAHGAPAAVAPDQPRRANQLAGGSSYRHTALVLREARHPALAPDLDAEQVGAALQDLLELQLSDLRAA